MAAKSMSVGINSVWKNNNPMNYSYGSIPKVYSKSKIRNEFLTTRSIYPG